MMGLSRTKCEQHPAPSDERQGLLPLNRIYPFVYCYPPRTAHIPCEAPSDLNAVWKEDGEPDADLNVYIHLPFCAYKCTFCKLYTVTTRREETELYDAYIEAILLNLHQLSDSIGLRNVRTVFVGGGTPFRVGVPRLIRLLDGLTAVFPNWRSTVEEVTVEATPDSILANSTLLPDLRSAGVNRISAGVQSLDTSVIKNAGRAQSGVSQIRESVEVLRSVGFDNINLDLIAGLFGQSSLSLQRSIEEVIQLAPDTVSLYALSPKVGTLQAKKADVDHFTGADDSLRLSLRMASDLLRSCEYRRESGVQYKRSSNGGLLHKQLYFEGVSVLGLGIGARSYTSTVDYTTGGEEKPTIDAVRDYISRSQSMMTASRGVQITPEEAMRRRILLPTRQVLKSDIPNDVDSLVAQSVVSVIEDAKKRGLYSETDDHLRLTEAGFLNRDAICWSLFSDNTLSRHQENGFDYLDQQRYLAAL